MSHLEGITCDLLEEETMHAAFYELEHDKYPIEDIDKVDGELVRYAVRNACHGEEEMKKRALDSYYRRVTQRKAQLAEEQAKRQENNAEHEIEQIAESRKRKLFPETETQDIKEEPHDVQTFNGLYEIHNDGLPISNTSSEANTESDMVFDSYQLESRNSAEVDSDKTRARAMRVKIIQKKFHKMVVEKLNSIATSQKSVLEEEVDEKPNLSPKVLATAAPKRKKKQKLEDMLSQLKSSEE